MDKVAIFYGSTTGVTKEVAFEIAKALKIDQNNVFDVAQTAPSKVGEYNNLIFGASTWGDGEMQSEMLDFLAGVSEMTLEGKKVAIFGTGDETNEDTFCDAVGEIYEKLQDTNAKFIGSFNTDGYDFRSSKALVDGEAVGLILDEINHPDLTPGRISDWCAKIESEF